MDENIFPHAKLANAISGFNRWRRDAMQDLGEVLEEEPDLAMANLAKGLILVGGRDTRFVSTIVECKDQAAAQQSTLAPHEAKYLMVLSNLMENRIGRGVDYLEGLTRDRPRDFFAHRLLQQELFWSGQRERMREVAVAARPHWRGDEDDYGNFLGLSAFGHEECGDYAEAERLGREAIERDASDAWGAHAVAHVLEMQGRTDDGIAWLESLNGNWAEANQIAHHVWWHLCLFYLERGDREKILEVLRQEVYNPKSPLVQAMPDLYIDIQNIASLLFRLQLRGVDVSDCWHDYVEVGRSRIGNHLSPFTSAHAAIILGGAGQEQDCVALIESMQQFVAEADPADDLAPRIAKAALPAARASQSWFQGDYGATVDHLLPAHDVLYLMGGSHAQRDIFTQMLYRACLSVGHDDAAKSLLASRAAVGYNVASENEFWFARDAVLH